VALRGIEEAARSPREGLKVTLEPIPGLTPPGLLGRNGFFFQTPPLDEFSRDYGHTHTDYSTINTGQFSRKAGRNLRATTFDALAVDYGAWTFYNGTPPEEIVETLIEICESGEPVLLTAAHDLPPLGYDNWHLTLAGPEVQWEATLRSMRVAETAGEGDTRYLRSLSFVEYRDPEIDRFGPGKKRSGGTSFPLTVELFMDGTATDSDGVRIGHPPADPVTLSDLARRYLKEPGAWAAIAKANGIKNWGPSDALVLYPGYRTRLMKGGSRTEVPADWDKFRHERVAKIKIPAVAVSAKGKVGRYAATYSVKGAAVIDF
jgi:hypothetical protein